MFPKPIGFETLYSKHPECTIIATKLTLHWLIFLTTICIISFHEKKTARVLEALLSYCFQYAVSSYIPDLRRTNKKVIWISVSNGFHNIQAKSTANLQFHACQSKRWSLRIGVFSFLSGWKALRCWLIGIYVPTHLKNRYDNQIPVSICSHSYIRYTNEDYVCMTTSWTQKRTNVKVT